MDNLAAVFPVLTLIASAGCVLLFVSTKTLRDSRDDQEKRIKFLEDKSARDDETIAGQAGQIDALGKVVTGEAHLVAIGDLLSEHHAEAKNAWTTLSGTLTHVDQTMTKLSQSLREAK